MFTIDNGNASVIDVTISGLTITGGNGRTAADGGGLFTANENLTLDRVVVTATHVGRQRRRHRRRRPAVA